MTALSVGPMHGVQPRPNSTPEQRAPRPGRRPAPGGSASRAASTGPRRGRPARAAIDEDAEHDGDLPLVGEQPLPHGADQRAEGDEDEGEAEHEQQRARQHPAAAGVGEVGAGEAGGVGEVAGQQRHHARREEGDQPGHQRDRDGEHQRAVVGRCWRTSRRGRAGVTTRSRRDVLDQVDQGAPARHLAEDARGHPALLVDDHGARDRARASGCRGRRAGCGRTGRRGRGRARRSGAGRPGPWSAAGVLGVHPEEHDAVARELAGGRGEGRRLLAARRAPRAPHVEHDDLAGVRRQVEVAALEGRAGHRAGLLALVDRRAG